jgi:urease accessory protein
MPDVQALLLADGRFPSGGYAHSGGLEASVAAGRVGGLPALTAFLEGRLATTGLVTAALAAAACSGRHSWSDLDAETDARIPSPALRQISRLQGRQLLRAARAIWDEPLPALAGASATPQGPHAAVTIGAVACAAGLDLLDAARWAAYEAVITPAAAGIRLLSLDPFAVTTLVAQLCEQIEQVAVRAAEAAGGPLGELPCAAAPMLDIAAEHHISAEVRLFAS